MKSRVFKSLQKDYKLLEERGLHLGSLSLRRTVVKIFKIDDPTSTLFGAKTREVTLSSSTTCLEHVKRTPETRVSFSLAFSQIEIELSLKRALQCYRCFRFFESFDNTFEFKIGGYDWNLTVGEFQQAADAVRQKITPQDLLMKPLTLESALLARSLYMLNHYTNPQTLRHFDSTPILPPKVTDFISNYHVRTKGSAFKDEEIYVKGLLPDIFYPVGVKYNAGSKLEEVKRPPGKLILLRASTTLPMFLKEDIYRRKPIEGDIREFLTQINIGKEDGEIWVFKTDDLEGLPSLFFHLNSFEVIDPPSESIEDFLELLKLCLEPLKSKTGYNSLKFNPFTEAMKSVKALNQ